MDKIRTALANIDVGQQVNKIDGSDVSLEASVRNILSVVFTVAGIIAVIMIIIGGVYYVISQGDTAKLQRAKHTIMYGIIGLIITLLAFAIVGFVLKGF